MRSLARCHGSSAKKVQVRRRSASTRGGNAHERQAEDAARRFVGGGSGLSRLLSPVPAAGFSLPSSPGEVLPPGIRPELESAFGADLSAVRIHRDEAAAAVARDFHARAFTAAEHIYFSPGCFDSASPAGRDLIAHELSHVLQQTAVSASNGRVRAQARMGGAGVQCQDDRLKGFDWGVRSIGDYFSTVLKILQPGKTGLDDARTVLALHQEQAAEEAVKTAIFRLRLLLQGRDRASALGVVRSEYAALPAPPPSAAMRHLFYDLFKAFGAFDDAAILFPADQPVTTALPLYAYYAARLRPGDASWVVGYLSTHAVAKRYFPGQVAAVLRMNFYGPARGPLNLDPEMRFDETVEAAIGQARQRKPLGAGEKELVALAALRVFDGIRKLPFRVLAYKLRKEKSRRVIAASSIELISLFTDPAYLAGIATKAGSEAEVIALATAVGPAVARAAMQAQAYWERVNALFARVFPGTAAGAGNAAEEQAVRFREQLPRRWQAIREAGPVENRLVAVVRRAFALSGGTLPPPLQYGANLSAGARELDRAGFLVDALLSRMTAKAAEQPADLDELPAELVLGLFLKLAWELRDELARYQPLAASDDAGRMRARDQALRHRVQTAHYFHTLATWFGMPRLQAVALRVALGTAIGLTRSHIALLADFEPAGSGDLENDLALFKRHFPSGTLRNFPLTGDQLIRFTFTLYYGEVARRLKELLESGDPATGTREKRFDPTSPVVNEVLAGMRDFHAPALYRVPAESVVQYIRPADEANISDIVPKNHPVVRELYDSYATRNDAVVTPEPRSAHEGGYVSWIVPGIPELAARLASLPGLSDLQLKDGTRIGSPDPTNPLPWLQQLEAALRRTRQGPDLERFIQGGLDTAWERLGVQLRRASSNRRRSLLPEIERTINAYDTGTLRKRLDTMFKPSQALRQILAFAGEVQPARDQPLQVTALLLELATPLYATLGPQRALLGLAQLRGSERLDIVLPLYPHLMGAAGYAKDQANRAALGQVMLAIGQGEIAAKAALLEALAGQFQQTVSEFQQQTQLVGSAARNQLSVPDRGYPVNAGDESASFLVGGIGYTLVRVHKDFRFVPAIAGGASAIIWPDARTAGLSHLRDAGGTRELERRGDPLIDISRSRGEGAEHKITVRDTDDQLLSELTYAVQMQVVMRQLKNLQLVMEETGSFVTLGLQLAFPELAAPMAAAEVVGSVMQFAASPEYAQIKQALNGDVAQLFEQAVARVKQSLRVETLWDYLLFGIKPSWATVLMPLGMHSRQKNLTRVTAAGGSRSALRVFGRLVHAGAGLAGGFERLQERFSLPVHKTALWVQGTPLVALLLRTIVRNLYRLQLLNLRELDPLAPVSDLLAQVQDLYRRTEELIATLSDYHLPDDIIPMNDLVLLGMDLFADHLPLKYRAAMKARKFPGLDKAWAKLGELVASEFKEAGIDPNIIWRSTVRGHIDPYLHDAAGRIAGELHALMDSIPFLKGLSPLTPRVAGMEFSAEAFPETPELQPSALPGRSLRALAAVWPGEGGTQLSTVQRGRFGRGFGHDFSHVRLHRGDEVDRSLDRIGARAVTSGSHVYLDSGVSPATQAGERIMGHELAHVLQQTGPRPLGVAHPSRPRQGRGGRGLCVQPAWENEADTLARAAREPARRPRDITSHGPTGVQPTLKDVVVRFFGDLGDPAKLIEHVEGKVRVPADGAKLMAAADDIRDTLGERLIDAIAAAGKPGSVVKFASLFREREIQDDLIAHILRNRLKRESARGEVRNLIGAAISGKKAGKGGASSGPQQELFTLDVGGLEVLIEEYLFARTGVNFDVEFDREKAAGAGGKSTKKINPAHPFSLLKLNYLHLPMLGGDHSLWDYFMSNSFPKVPADKRPLYQAKARLALLGLKPGPGIYEKRKVQGRTVLAFARKVRELVEEYVHPPAGKALPSDRIPPWSDYVKTAPQQSVGAHGQIGLRLGFYSQRKAPGNQYGEDRASHHTVQYLLLEYLDNSKGNYRPFRHSLDLYPNIEASGGRVEAVTSEPDRQGDRIEIGKNMPDRGGTMPTILIAKHTHQLGDVHVSARSDEDAGGASQGAAVHGDFMRNLGPYEPIVNGTSNEGLRAIRGMKAALGKKPDESTIPRVGNEPVTGEMLSRAIFTAACKSYTEMRATMLDKLMAALNREEIEYYTSVVAGASDPNIIRVAGTTREPMPAYRPQPLGSTFREEVKRHTVGTLESKAFGFKEM